MHTFDYDISRFRMVDEEGQFLVVLMESPNFEYMNANSAKFNRVVLIETSSMQAVSAYTLK